MGCLTVKLTRVGGIEASLTRVCGGISATFTKVGGMTCRLGLVCKPNILHPYLEIEPELIWVYPDWATDNNVYSNTSWKVN